MDQQYNPFEDALKETGAAPNPFPVADFFGNANSLKTAAPLIALGSQPEAENPFEDPDETPDAITSTAQVAKLDETQDASPANSLDSTLHETLDAIPSQSQVAIPGKNQGEAPDNDEIPNPIAQAMDKQAQTSLFSKLPVFEHGAVREAIENLAQTFDDLRIAKADDFPELEDGIRVSWDVTYGKIRKTVPTPKKTQIGEFKASIEKSKEFLDALKKEKDKSPDCVVKPRITAQSKGDAMPADCALYSMPACVTVGMSTGVSSEMPAYKGVYTNMEDAENSQKPICIVPGSDGLVYEIRREKIGTFITPSGECKSLSDVRAGFLPALPLIPRWQISEVIAFFRSLVQDNVKYEAVANIYWDCDEQKYITVIPKQRVTSISADSELSDDIDAERYLHYMDIHSHNIMPAMFSMQDDRDEKATRLYAVIGRLDRYLPEMDLRLSNGGKFLSVNPKTVFESLNDFYPSKWHDYLESCVSEMSAAPAVRGKNRQTDRCWEVMCA